MRPHPDHGEATYEGTGRLPGRRALVTGGDSGIGRAVAIAFAREGADVTIGYLSEDADAEVTVKEVQAAGRTGTAIRGDVGDPGMCARLVQSATEAMGGLDIVVNNAAVQALHDAVEDIPEAEIESVFRTNVLAQFWVCQAAIPHMPPGSSIINTTSIQSYRPNPALIHYASSKGAVTTFTKALAKDLIARKGIRVNGVAPGPVWTPLVAMSFGSALAEFGGDTPMGRPAQPAEIAPLYVFLASDASGYIVGEIVGITGGREIS